MPHKPRGKEFSFRRESCQQSFENPLSATRQCLSGPPVVRTSSYERFMDEPEPARKDEAVRTSGARSSAKTRLLTRLCLRPTRCIVSLADPRGGIEAFV